MENLAIAVLDEADRGQWRDYVDARPDATLFHDLRWLDAVEDAYRCRNYRLVARRGTSIVAILPLSLVAAPLLGRSLISVAFGVGGGIIADDAEAARALGEHALQLGRALRVNYVELRGGAAPGGCYAMKIGHHVSFEKALPADAGEIMERLPRKRRAEVRKSLSSEDGAGNSERITNDVAAFYRVYAASVRNLGTPVMPRRFLDALLARFGEEAEIDLVENDGAVVAGLFSFWRKDRVMPYYVGAGARARETRAFDFLYYSLMRRAVGRGVRIFDFGRSKANSTHAETKAHWGFDAAPVIAHVALIRARSLPNLSPKNPKFERFVSVWRRLPLPVANFLGPIVARNFP
jgi:FemAB-related protein (PEP-CTERM system-associated)